MNASPRTCKAVQLAVLLIAAVDCASQNLASWQREFIRIHAPVIALEHTRVVDGTGSGAKSDQTILISGSTIAEIGDAGAVRVPRAAMRFNFSGHTAFPGLVGMHDHLFYVTTTVNDNFVAHDMPLSFPRLFLAAGVTTIRTAGSYEPYADIQIKHAIDGGRMIGPKMNLTAPYLVDSALGQIQIHALTGPEDARRTVSYWADEGMTSFKVYEFISRKELEAVIETAHARGLPVAGHLCSIGFSEAALMGIDSLEHGLFVDTEFDPKKQPDACPQDDWPAAVNREVSSPEIQGLIRTLIEHHVAVTSTLPVIEHHLASWQGLQVRALECLSPDSLQAYRAYLAQNHNDASDPSKTAAVRRYADTFKKEMEFELAFEHAGGLLLAGSDAVLHGVIAGFADQRELELLVQAGFTPVEAIHIATWNGARFLKQADHIGSLTRGKQADIVIVKGDPAEHIEDVEKVEVVFKDGIGYDSRKLIASVQRQVGTR